MKIAHRNHTKDGFTLIEILVVMGIVGILASLLFPGVAAAKNTANNTHATNTCMNLKNAVGAYFTEYRRYPLIESTQSDYTTEENSILDILLASDDQTEKTGKNPRGIVFYTDKAARRFTDSSYVKGIRLNANGGGSLWDPWGNNYGMRIDIEAKGRMKHPASGFTGSGIGEVNWPANFDQVIPESVAVFSAGKEGSKKIPSTF